MKFFSIASLLFACLAANIYGEKFSFDGFRLVRLFPKNADHVELIRKLGIANSDFDLWNMVKGVSADVLLSPKSFENYLQVFETNGLSFEIIDNNIQNKIEEQQRSMLNSRDSKNIIFKYARYGEINNFVDDIVADNQDLASSYTIGTTAENRVIKTLVLKTASSSRAIWIDCGMHAREWVSPATCVYTVQTLIDEYRNKDPVTVALLNKYEFHIVPLLNPDGYEYSHSTFRLWRKNRSKNAGSSCIGTDLNRNFAYRWLTGGSSTSPCSDVYAGASPESELETKAVVNAINAKSGKWDAFLSVHSYGCWWLTPYGHSSSTTERPSDYSDLVNKAKFATDAIKAYNGTNYVIGTSAELLYINTGTSADWAKGAANVKYSYVLELRPGPNTPDYSYGFTLPEDRMPRVATETYLGIKAFVNAI